MTILDAELLAALRPEWQAACAALAAAADPPGAKRALAALRGLAEGAALDVAIPQTDATLTELHAAAAGLARVLDSRSPSRVLLVDDSRTIRRLLRDLLATDAAFTIAGEAGDGREGLAQMELLKPDLTLLDLEMPVLDGMGLLAEWALRGHGEVIVVSSVAQPGSAAALEALRRGAYAALAKPSGALSPDLVPASGKAILAAARAACRR